MATTLQEANLTTAGLKSIGHWIGGVRVEPQGSRTGTVWNPATGEPQASVCFASREDVDRAVANSLAASTAWRATPLSRRAEILFRLRDLIDSHRKQLAELLSLEHGKTLPDALGEVARGLENIEFACGIPA